MCFGQTKKKRYNHIPKMALYKNIKISIDYYNQRQMAWHWPSKPSKKTQTIQLLWVSVCFDSSI